MAKRILAVDDNRVNLKVLAASLRSEGYEVFTTETGEEALSKVKEIQPDLIVLDISMPGINGFEVCERLRSNPSTAPIAIIMLTAHTTLEDKIRGFEVGADDYVTKPYEKEELCMRIRVLLQRRPRPIQEEPSAVRCKTLAVFSLRGGVGVSSLSANLAVGLARLWEKPVALIDLVLTMGQSALMLDMPLRKTWVDIARTPFNRLDFSTLQNIFLEHNSGVSVLAAPRYVEEARLVAVEWVRRTLDLLKSQFHYIVLDLPHDVSEITMTGLNSADEILLVMAPELASVRATVGTLEFLSKSNLSKPIHIVQNNVIGDSGFVADVEKVLKRPVNFVIPLATDAFVNAINRGIPPVLTAANSLLGAQLEEMAFSLSRAEDQQLPLNVASEARRRIKRMVKTH